MGTIQMVYLAIMLLNLGIHLAKHGEPRNENYNFWMCLIASVIEYAILKYGGFF